MLDRRAETLKRGGAKFERRVETLERGGAKLKRRGAKLKRRTLFGLRRDF